MIWLAVCLVVIQITSASVLLASDSASDTEKWVAPVLTSVLNIFSSLFAYMIGRDRLKYDSAQAIKDAKLEQQEKDLAEQKSECNSLEHENRRVRGRVARLTANLHAAKAGQALPYPNETGLSFDEDTMLPTIPPAGGS